MVDAISQGVAFNLAVNRKRTVFAVVVKLHLGSVETSLAVDKITNSGIFDDHFGPKRIAWETEEISAVRSGNFYDYIGPASKNVLSMLDSLVWKSICNNSIQRIFGSEKICHRDIITYVYCSLFKN